MVGAHPLLIFFQMSACKCCTNSTETQRYIHNMTNFHFHCTCVLPVARPPSRGSFQIFYFMACGKILHAASTYKLGNTSDVLVNSPLNLTLVGLHPAIGLGYEY